MGKGNQEVMEQVVSVTAEGEQITPFAAFKEEAFFTKFADGLIKIAGKDNSRLGSRAVYNLVRILTNEREWKVTFDWIKRFVHLAERKGILIREKNGKNKSFWFRLGDVKFKSRRTARKQKKRVVSQKEHPKAVVKGHGNKMLALLGEQKLRQLVLLRKVLKVLPWLNAKIEKEDLPDEILDMTVSQLIVVRETMS